MTRRLLISVVLSAWVLAGQQMPRTTDDPVLRAMRDELERARTLRIEGLDAPYFIEYSVHEARGLSIAASLGALVNEFDRRMRLPLIRVRVGDYQFDDGNYVRSGAQVGSRYDLGALPIDDDYAALRSYFWLATDTAYKSALEVIARKRAALRNVNASDQLPDFSKADPNSVLANKQGWNVDEQVWKSRIRSLSALFATHPQIVDSSVVLDTGQGTFYLVNSEGTVVRVPEGSSAIRVRAIATAPDGMQVRDTVGFHALALSEMPSETELRRGVQSVAENVEALMRAPRGEAYTGPVLFEPEAAAQFLAQVLGRNLALRRRPVPEAGRPIPFVQSELESRLGSRILPEWMDVVDDPTATEFGGHRLFGYYLVDLEGVPPKPLVLVQGGILRNYLMTRQPMRGAAGSNGRARLLGTGGAQAASFSNLFVRVAKSVALSDLKKQLLELCSQRSLPYGLLVRKIDYPSAASGSEYRRMVSGTSGAGAGLLVSHPVLVYRVYGDGREELVRGLRFTGVQIRSLRDIVAAGGEPVAFDYEENGAPFALLGAASYTAESSVVAPGILFEELQLERSEGDLPKLPIVPPPPLTATR